MAETETVEDEAGFPFRSSLHVHQGQIEWLASEKDFDADAVDDEGNALWTAAEIVAAAYATRVEWRKTDTYHELVEAHKAEAEQAKAEAKAKREAAAAQRKADADAAKAEKEAKAAKAEKPAAKATKATKASKTGSKASAAKATATKATAGRRGAGRRGAAAKPTGDEDPFA